MNMKFLSLSQRPFILALVLASLFLTGCASITNGSQQEITVKTGKTTEIYIDGRYAGKGYSRKKLARDQTHVISLALGECKRTITTEARFNKMTLMGLLLDLGLVSIPVDFINGAAWNIYPSKIESQPSCNDSDQL